MLFVQVVLTKQEIYDFQNGKVEKCLVVKLKRDDQVKLNLIYLKLQQVIDVEYNILLKYEHLLQYYDHY